MGINGSRQEDYKDVLEWQKGNSSVSNAFKLWVVAFIFFLIFLYLYARYKYPQANVISDEVILGVVLVSIAYIWIQEFRDRHRLQSLNKSLIEIHEQLQRADRKSVV